MAANEIGWVVTEELFREQEYEKKTSNSKPFLHFCTMAANEIGWVVTEKLFREQQYEKRTSNS
jgi:stalled ribosome alternative rescue factor ArfA